jgi:hypothetical protein
VRLQRVRHQSTAHVGDIMDKLPTLTAESLAAFMKQLHDDPALKLAVITGLGENGLVATVERYFRVSARQRKLLAKLQAHKGAEQAWASIISGTLLAGGTVVLTESTKEFSGSGEVHVGPDGFSGSVSVEC